jgi:hypothetical protein
MPMQPPPGFEEAFDAPCPSCGQRVGDHTPETHHEHLIVFMSDPDRTVDEILEYSAGVIASFAHCFHIGLPQWAVENIIGMQYGDYIEALRRRKS